MISNNIMNINTLALDSLSREFMPRSYVRVFPSCFSGSPLGTGQGASRFSSTLLNFTTLYAAESLATALAETILRDRFEGVQNRTLHISEIKGKCAALIHAVKPLKLLDLRSGGCFKLGLSTDIMGGRNGWDQARELAQYIHDHSNFDGILYKSRFTGENAVAAFDRSVQTNLTCSQVSELYQLKALTPALEDLFVQLVS